MRTVDGMPPQRHAGRSVRARLALLAAVPTTALIVVVALGVVTQVADMHATEAAVHGVRLVQSTQDVIHELQGERALSSGFVAGDGRSRGQLDQQRARVDRARAAWPALDDVGAAGRAVAAAGGRLADLGTVRQRVDARTVDPMATIGFFTALIDDLGDAANRQLLGPDDAELSRGLTTLRTIDDATEYAEQERAIGNAVFVANSFGPSGYRASVRADAGRAAGFQAFRAVASPAESARLDAAVASPAGARVAGLWARALDNPTALSLGVNAAQWDDETTTFTDELRAIRQAVVGDVDARADALRSAADTVLACCLALALLVLVTAVVLVVAANRAVVRPVIRLTGHAEDIARRRLPQAVTAVGSSEGDDVGEPPEPGGPVGGRGRGDREIVALGTALDDLAHTAVGLVSEQSGLRHNTATSLAALGRRNQDLVRRQLGLIDDLERDESDPAVLADLFALDHLATRMRRNAESVLVLVGEQATRRWSSSVPVDEVLRAAISEVEDYPRVELAARDRGAVAGRVAPDITHIAAELLENALAFSPPDRPVELHGRKIDGAYLIAIVDHGTGMTDHDLGVANARLRAGERVLVAPTRFLGHYVVGTLARRLGIEVTLQRSPLTGLTARISVPDALLVATGPAEVRSSPAPARPAPGSIPLPRDGSASAVPAPAAPEQPTTPSGLVKRVRGAASPDTSRDPDAGPEHDLAERSPDEVRSMLTAFRQGVGRADPVVPAPAEDGSPDTARADVDGDDPEASTSVLLGEER